MLIETTTFHLSHNSDDTAFLSADRRVQTEVVPNQPGFLRRATARDADGDWIVIVLWDSEADADAAAGEAAAHPATAEFSRLIDGSTLSRRRYTTLD